MLLKQNGIIKFDTSISSISSGKLNILEYSDKICTVIDTPASLNFFLIKNFNKFLDEGKISITLTTNKEKKITYYTNVVWENKPQPLLFTKLAIELLEVIDGENIVSKLLSYPKDKQYQKLKEYRDQKSGLSKGRLSFING